MVRRLLASLWASEEVPALSPSVQKRLAVAERRCGVAVGAGKVAAP